MTRSHKALITRAHPGGTFSVVSLDTVQGGLVDYLVCTTKDVLLTK